jgi:hypothetical protein
MRRADVNNPFLKEGAFHYTRIYPMRELRTVYNAPCRTGKFCKPSYVPTRVDVAVGKVPTGTGKAMLHPFSKPSTGVARLGGIGRIHEFHHDACRYCLVPDKVLKLTESPAMQPRPHPKPGLDAVPDMGEILHADSGGSCLKGLSDDGFADLMVDVADMPLLPARDSLQLPFGSTAAVGLEATTFGKVAIPFIPEFFATKDLAGARSGEVVFPDIQAHGHRARKGCGVREVEHQVEIPGSLALNEPGLLRLAGLQKRLLKRATGKANGSAAHKGKEGEGVSLDRIGTVIKVDGSGREVEVL